MRFWHWPRLVAAALLLALAVPTLAFAQTAAPAAPAPRKNPFDGVKSWAYQLTNLGEAQRKRIAESSYDLVVVDYAWEEKEGGPEFPLTREQVEAMKRKPDGSKRMIIAYLSAGEAENNRYYWKPEWNAKKPSWIGKENKDWKGNYLVQYWQPAWQSIVFGSPDSFVDRVLAGGFDGFYIDRADAYYYFGDTTQARDRMTDYITRLISYIRSKQPNAAILIQNAEELLERPKFVEAIDGIAKEDLQFGIKHKEELNKQAEIDWSTNLLLGAQKKGKAIFVVEYLQQPANIEKAKAFMKERNFVLYYGPRGLYEIMDPNAPAPTPVAATPGAASKSEPKPSVIKKTYRAVKSKLKGE